jgi:subtilisin family serine protease
MTRFGILTFAVLIGLFCLGTPAVAIPLEDGTYEPDRLLVKFNAETDPAVRAALHGRYGGQVIRTFRLDPDLELVGFLQGTDVGSTIDLYLREPVVRYAEPDYIYHTQILPNDTRFGDLWGMHNTGQSGGLVDFDIDGPEGWDVNTQAPGIVIGSIDTGVDINHQDLSANIWTNPGEIPANGVDDDANGYVDDIHGWDFLGNDSNPQDDNSHGTHTMGTAAAVGNNGVGVAGVTWSAQIMVLKICNAGGGCDLSAAVAATDYATENGAKVTSNSWGGGGYSQAMKDAIDRANAAGVLYVAAAGNNGTNSVYSPFYPASYDSPNIISVANMTRFGTRSGSSNYGLITVDLGAPGTDIWSTTPNNGYGSKTGTSMACPHVTGAVANIMGFNPTLGHLDYKDILLQSVEPNDDLAGRTVTGGMLNLRKALDLTPPLAVPPENDPPVANAGGPYKGRAYSPVTFDGSGSYDPDAQQLGDFVATYIWDFGDGSIATTSSPTITHTYAFENRDYVVTLKVKDKYRVSSLQASTTTCVIRGGGRKTR